MKRIQAIIKPFTLQAVIDGLHEVGTRLIIVSECKGFGRQKGQTEIYRGSEYAISFLPKTALEIVAESEQVGEIIRVILKNARTEKIGDGKIFVSAIACPQRLGEGVDIRRELESRHGPDDLLRLTSFLPADRLIEIHDALRQTASGVTTTEAIDYTWRIARTRGGGQEPIQKSLPILKLEMAGLLEGMVPTAERLLEVLYAAGRPEALYLEALDQAIRIRTEERGARALE